MVALTCEGEGLDLTHSQRVALGGAFLRRVQFSLVLGETGGDLLSGVEVQLL